MYAHYLKDIVDDGLIPGAVLYVSKNKETKFFQAFGSFVDKNNIKQPIYQNTIFDLASLTKIMATLPSALYLTSKKEIDFNQSVTSYFSDFKYPDIKIRHLLLHCSGLPADLPYLERAKHRDVIKDIFQTTLLYPTASKTLYSDLGMILLGKIIEKVVCQPLDVFVSQNIFKIWQLNDTAYLLPDEKKALVASTEWYKDRFIQGEVHDEKAFQMDGVSGSAGLFSTAKDIATFSAYWLYPEEQDLIKPELLRDATLHRQNNRSLGFEVWSGSGEVLSCGDKWAVGSFGHTGFTGTSVWIDPIHELIVILLTNAVHFGRNTDIKNIRKKLHTLIHSSLIEEVNL